MPMGVNYLVIAFDLEVQPFVTHNAACPLGIWCEHCSYVVSSHNLFAQYAMNAIDIDVLSGHKLFANRS